MSQFIHTDVTAVKSYRNLILSGIGSSISVFEKESFKLLTRIKCLEGQKIYGLVPLENSSKVLVFGGKQYTVIKFNEDCTNVERLFMPPTCDDWLHSAVWVDADSVALLTAHNTIQIWNVTTESMLSQHLSTDNSILYSGLLLPLQDGLVVFAGTVYSEVIIHTPQNEKPLHILKGHRVWSNILNIM
ncbi:uncharacterized protein LOC114363736 [Ostrinia furnacalis]|uniref:uncharacterized protein LOC114363736 n=1 Tax=Ostrinia furnacalis TaxID=93504 RepID=UPI00103A99EC|nr:uncharacterized protein LOC114363736 [Ostrinia furnacalis]